MRRLEKTTEIECEKAKASFPMPASQRASRLMRLEGPRGRVCQVGASTHAKLLCICRLFAQIGQLSAWDQGYLRAAHIRLKGGLATDNDKPMSGACIAPCVRSAASRRLRGTAGLSPGAWT